MSAGRNELVQLTAFTVGEESYVVDIMRVRQILRPMPITPVRKGPKFVEGVINLRGSVIPVVDLRKRFDLPAEMHPHRRIMVVAVNESVVGIVVDRVTAVVRIERERIRPAPQMLGREAAPYFMGVCRDRGKSHILLNVKNILGTESKVELPDFEINDSEEHEEKAR